MRRHEIVLGGFGGQGIKVIASLLGQAVHAAGGHAMMYNIYAAAIRGGPIFCTVLVFDEPSQGVDVGAKAEIFGLIEGLAAAGRGVILISSDFAELATVCTRTTRVAPMRAPSPTIPV